jgi:hypothetical protein
MSRLIVVGSWAASIAAAVWLARPSEPGERAAPAPRREVAREARVIPPPSDAVSPEDVRRAVREELAAARAPAAATAERAAPEAADETAPEVVAEARTIVRGAIDAGRWTDAAREQLRMRVASLPRAELDAVLSELFVAVNAGRIRPDVTGPLL